MAKPHLDGTRAARTGWVQPLVVSTPYASVRAPFRPVRGTGEALALSHLSPGMASGLHPCLGFSGPGDTPGKALVPMGKCPSLPLLHPDLSSIGLTSGAEPGGVDVLAGAPGQGAVGACAPCHPHALAPHAPLGPALGRMSTDFPVPAPAKSKAPAAKRAGAAPWPCQDHPQATPGVPDGEAEGAGSHHGSCHLSHRHVDVSPLAHGARGVLCAWADGVGGSGAGAVGTPDTCPSPTDTHTVPGLRSLPQALLPEEPRGGAGALPCSLGLSTVNHKFSM